MGTPSTLEPKAPGCRDARTWSTEPKGIYPVHPAHTEGTLSLYIYLVRTVSLFRGTNPIRIPIPLKAHALGRSQLISSFIPEEPVSPTRTLLPTENLNSNSHVLFGFI